VDCKVLKQYPFFRTRYRLAAAFLVSLFLVHSSHIVHAGSAAQGFRLATSSDRAESFVIGRVARSARKHSKRVSALADQIAEGLSGFGYKKGASLIAENLEDMIKHLKSGAVDMISETAYGAVELADKGGETLLAHEWKDGVPYYRSVIVARKDSGLNDLQSLRGKSMALEDSSSTTAYFIPLTIVHRAGLPTRRMQSPRTRRLPDTVNYLFAQGETNQISLVLNKAVDVAAFSSLNWEMISEQNEKILQLHKIIYTSRPIVRSLVLLRKDMKVAVREKIMEILENLDQSDEGRHILKKYNNVEQFTTLTDEALASLMWVRKLREPFKREMP
jgi:phosphonate transport system substrate-binding protein